ncbi:MAG TPA: 3-hydroxyacyl-CoA dehydrogenase NAD-binding domain-containing protein, partial [Nitrospiraceae bacterium]|nr:3-hydroxyacyl-CoA dehydrogenase NAD-binding domain-containing protein [Nitrospiraceae bacterium]
MRLEDIKTIGIVGAGQMGCGISQVCATAGYHVLLVDVADPALTEALTKIRVGLERAVERGSLTDHQAGVVLALIRPMVQLNRLRDVQLVIEAIPEDLALKQELFAELNRICQPETV